MTTEKYLGIVLAFVILAAGCSKVERSLEAEKSLAPVPTVQPTANKPRVYCTPQDGRPVMVEYHDEGLGTRWDGKEWVTEKILKFSIDVRFTDGGDKWQEVAEKYAPEGHVWTFMCERELLGNLFRALDDAGVGFEVLPAQLAKPAEFARKKHGRE